MLARIARDISDHGGWISFARYMELALHGPGGYYAGGARKFGAEGDFVTAPEMGSLFGRTLARQLAEILGENQSILEIGAGSGALAETLLSRLPGVDYAILETSPELAARQKARLGSRARWLTGLPMGFRGVVLANEVVDAMPVHAVAWRERGIFERGVAFDGTSLRWAERPAEGALLEAARQIHVPAPYESEVGLAGHAWIRSLGDAIQEGVVLVIDYGFPAREYYHPQRARGTLMCHHRHRAHDEVFSRPGEQDITAHVDFSALARAAGEARLDVLGYATQAQFLVNCGITDELAQANVENALRYAPLAAEANRLLSPAEMGELFKVLALGRRAPATLAGFSRNDRSHTL
jgi:SAM-dependent MidA family methyltransferase